MFIYKSAFRLIVDNDGGFLLTIPNGENDEPSRCLEIDIHCHYSGIHIDFWGRRGIELECYPCLEHDLEGNPTRPYHKFIAYPFWGVYGMDLVMKLYRNKWGIPRLAFSREVYD
jgi:hypothetical protein